MGVSHGDWEFLALITLSYGYQVSTKLLDNNEQIEVVATFVKLSFFPWKTLCFPRVPRRGSNVRRIRRFFWKKKFEWKKIERAKRTSATAN